LMIFLSTLTSLARSRIPWESNGAQVASMAQSACYFFGVAAPPSFAFASAGIIVSRFSALPRSCLSTPTFSLLLSHDFCLLLLGPLEFGTRLRVFLSLQDDWS